MPHENKLKQLIKRGMMRSVPRFAFLVNGEPESRRVALTFDDGPHPELTPRLLDVLKAEGVSATFFVIGERAHRYPALVQRMAREGHSIGNHSYTHSEPKHTSARELQDELVRTARLLRELTGRAPSLFRPPKGMLSPAKLLLAWRARQTVALWNRDPKDYESSSASVADYFRRHPLLGGDIVLMHDTQPHAEAVLPELVRACHEQGLQFVTLDELVKLAPGRMLPSALSRLKLWGRG